MVTEPEKSSEIELNERQKRFCNNFVSKDFFANGTESYIDAYDIDVNKKGAYEGAKAHASRLLKYEGICKYINSLLDDAGLNDNFVDKQLLFLINQQADFGSKIAAIREYNKLKSRIVEKSEVKSEMNFKGDPFAKIRSNAGISEAAPGTTPPVDTPKE